MINLNIPFYIYVFIRMVQISNIILIIKSLRKTFHLYLTYIIMKEIIIYKCKIFIFIIIIHLIYYNLKNIVDNSI